MSLKVVFAENEKHASAFIKWFVLDEKMWHPNKYGGELKESYESAILVRPFGGVTKEHFLWISNFLYPKVDSPNKIIPIHWFYEEYNDLKTEIDLLSQHNSLS